MIKQNGEYMSKANRRLQPDSSDHASSANENDEDDFDDGASIDRATAYANQRNQVPGTDSSAKKNQTNSPKGKGKGKASEQEKVTVAIVNIANQCLRTTSEELLQFETSMNSHLKAEGSLERIRRSKIPMKGILAL